MSHGRGAVAMHCASQCTARWAGRFIIRPIVRSSHPVACAAMQPASRAASALLNEDTGQRCINLCTRAKTDQSKAMFAGHTAHCTAKKGKNNGVSLWYNVSPLVQVVLPTRRYMLHALRCVELACCTLVLWVSGSGQDKRCQDAGSCQVKLCHSAGLRARRGGGAAQVESRSEGRAAAGEHARARRRTQPLPSPRSAGRRARTR